MITLSMILLWVLCGICFSRACAKDLLKRGELSVLDVFLIFCVFCMGPIGAIAVVMIWLCDSGVDKISNFLNKPVYKKKL